MIETLCDFFLLTGLVMTFASAMVLIAVGFIAFVVMLLNKLSNFS